MIRQAQSYLAGAATSAALLAAAITTFVLLASFAAFRDWPTPGAGGPDEPVPSIAGGAPAEAAAGALSPAPDFVAASAPVGPPLTAGGTAGTSAFFEGAPPPGESGGPTPPRGPIGPLPEPGPTPPSGVSIPAPPPQAPSTSGQVAGTVNNTVSQVDQTLGGTLGQLGVTQTVHSATSGLVGPGSAGGQALDGVGGLLNGPGN